jgi:hypothetical protein
VEYVPKIRNSTVKVLRQFRFPQGKLPASSGTPLQGDPVRVCDLSRELPESHKMRASSMCRVCLCDVGRYHRCFWECRARQREDYAPPFQSRAYNAAGAGSLPVWPTGNAEQKLEPRILTAHGPGQTMLALRRAPSALPSKQPTGDKRNSPESPPASSLLCRYLYLVGERRFSRAGLSKV